MKQQRRELEKAKIIDYSEKIKTDDKRQSVHQRMDTGGSFITAMDDGVEN